MRGRQVCLGALFVRFSGAITPSALPRQARAPIAVRLAGTVKTLSGERPPALRPGPSRRGPHPRLDPDSQLPRAWLRRPLAVGDGTLGATRQLEP